MNTSGDWTDSLQTSKPGAGCLYVSHSEKLSCDLNSLIRVSQAIVLKECKSFSLKEKYVFDLLLIHKLTMGPSKNVMEYFRARYWLEPCEPKREFYMTSARVPAMSCTTCNGWPATAPLLHLLRWQNVILSTLVLFLSGHNFPASFALYASLDRLLGHLSASTNTTSCLYTQNTVL